MKTLKFRKGLDDLILSGEKTVTWRLFDDKDLQVGDKLTFLVRETLEEFAKAEIVHINEKKLGEITEEDYTGHERYKNHQDMLDHFKKYYGDQVGLDTVVKIIKFK